MKLPAIRAKVSGICSIIRAADKAKQKEDVADVRKSKGVKLPRAGGPNGR